MRRDELVATRRAHERELRVLRILRVAAFGSVARGDETSESDVDPMVAFDETTGHSLPELRLDRHLTELLWAEVHLSFEPLGKAGFRARVGQEQVRAS